MGEDRCGEEWRRSSGRHARREARREGILDVARALFLTRGFAATSMAMIAEQVGGSKSTLYHHFPHKQDLFAAVMHRECARQALPLFDRIVAGDVEAKLYELGRGLLDFILAGAALELQRVIIAEVERFPELGQLFYDNGPRLVGERLQGLLQRMMADGALTVADPQLAAGHFSDLVLSNVYRLRLWGVGSAPTKRDLDRQARNAIDAFLKIYGRKR